MGYYSKNNEDRQIQTKILQEATSTEEPHAINQMSMIMQVGTLGKSHLFPFGFIIWAPKLMGSHLSILVRMNHVFFFSSLPGNQTNLFKYGTVAYHYRKEHNYLRDASFPKHFADLVDFYPGVPI